MSSIPPQMLIEIITEEVMKSLSGGAGVSAPGTASPAPPDPFILSPEAFIAPARALPEEQTIANGYVPIGISARHCHLSAPDLETLFGPDAPLTPFKNLRQLGEYAAQQTVTLVGPRMRALEGIRILGPTRGGTQVELSLTDAIYLGLRPPVRASGDHRDTPGILLIGPRGFVSLRSGVIRANRHIHLSTDDARHIGVTDNEKVLVRIAGDRPVIYHDVQVRVKESFVAEMHLDTDDANAVGVGNGDPAQIIRGYHECRLCETCAPPPR